MEKIVNKLINHIIKDADTYVHEGSTWLIFTDTRKWVIELTKDRTLWYNYNLFKNAFAYASMDVVENQDYITKWVEDNIIGVNIIGVNRTNSWNESLKRSLDDFDCITKVIQEGVKHTDWRPFLFNDIIENTIQNGINRTKEMDEWVNTPRIVGEVIDNGIKETKSMGLASGGYSKSVINYVIENGVKNIRGIENDRSFFIENTLKMGVKEVQPLPSQEGNKDWGIYYHKKQNRTKPHTEYVDDAIKLGVKDSLD